MAYKNRGSGAGPFKNRGPAYDLQFISNLNNFTLANIATEQSPFEAANDTLNVSSGTYTFEGFIYNTGLGAVTRTTAFLFGGTATIDSIMYQSMIITGAAGAALTTQTTKTITVPTATAMNATVATAMETITVKGIVRISTAGTFIPEINWSADPTGTPICEKNSYFALLPICAATVAAINGFQ